MGMMDKLKESTKKFGADAGKAALENVLDSAIETATQEIDALPNPPEEKELMKEGVQLLKKRVQEGLEKKLG